MNPDSATKRGVRLVTLGEDSHGQRIDNYLRSALPGVPKSRIYRLIRTGQVRVNGGRVKAMHKLAAGDEVRIPPVRIDAGGSLRPPDDYLEQVREAVLFDDGDIVVINKPSGMASHSGSGVPFGIADALKTLFGDARLVHRLDRPTSGCLVAARKRTTLNDLQQQIRKGAMHKHYLTLLLGHWNEGTQVIEDRLVPKRGGERKVRVGQDGQQARATFRPLSIGETASYLEVVLETGRTHQIRVQAANAGHPVAGDERYGDPAFNLKMGDLGLERMFLHAHRVSFDAGTQGRVDVHAPLPAELAAILDRLGLG